MTIPSSHRGVLGLRVLDLSNHKPCRMLRKVGANGDNRRISSLETVNMLFCFMTSQNSTGFCDAWNCLIT